MPVARVLDAADLTRVVGRISHEILEKSHGPDDLILLGIPRRGVPLAQRIAERMHSIEGVDVPVGSLDVTMYRDDIGLRGARPLGTTDVPLGGIDDRIVVLVDDVLFSGRTIRSALDALNDIGRPRAVRLAVLIDRGHRNFRFAPITSGRTFPPREPRMFGSTWWKRTGWMRCCSARPRRVAHEAPTECH